MSNAIETQGTLFEVESAASPAVWIEIGEVVNFQGFDGSAADIDVTHLQSTAKERRMGLQDWGNFNLDVNYLTEDPGQEELRDAKSDRQARNIRVTLANGAMRTFAAFVSSAPMSGGVDSKVDGSFNLLVTGDVTNS